MVKATTQNTFTTELAASEHLILADEPLSLGGKNLGMKPGELLCASLASCTNITLRMYINRKEWQVTELETKVDFADEFPHEKMNVSVSIAGDLDEAKLKRITNIAGKCPIHKILAKSMEINVLVNFVN